LDDPANREGAYPPSVRLLRRSCDEWISLRASLPRRREKIQSGLRSSTILRGLAFSLTLYSNQRTHNDEIGIRTEGKAHREPSTRRWTKADKSRNIKTWQQKVNA
jgi:hypothetical protein